MRPDRSTLSTGTAPPIVSGPTACVVGLCLLAVVFGVQATAGLRWPPEGDLMRDVAAARAIADGRYPQDPAYLGEVWWYNPLVPALVAALTKISGLSVEVLYAQAGTYLNVLAALAFYRFARGVVGSWPAVAALVAYLFLGDPNRGSMFQATYSPWLYPYNFVQALSFITLHEWQRAMSQPSLKRYLAVGLLLGLVFLGHVAPTLIIGFAIAGSHAALALRTRSTWSGEARRVLVVAAAALTVASIFLLPILMRYRFQIANPDPGNLTIVGGRVVLEHFASVRGLLTIVGAAALVSQLRREPRKELLPFCSALAVAALFLTYGLLAARFGLPSVVPSFHFHIYLTAFGAVLFGHGLAEIADAIARYAPRRVRLRSVHITACALALGLVLQLFQYRTWIDLQAMRASSLWVQRNRAATALYAWLAGQPREGAVLTSIESSLWIAASGHPVVAAFPTYSNPYVSFESRERAASALWAAWDRGDAETALRLASEHQVRYIVVEGRDDRAFPRSARILRVFAQHEAQAASPLPLAQSTTFFPPVPFMDRVSVFRIESPERSSP